VKLEHLFEVGDRVKAVHQTNAITHGIVVYYRGKHNPENPRVRWHSGWGTTCSAKKLIPLTLNESINLPIPTLCSIDL
jgi:hypothetical protein